MSARDLRARVRELRALVGDLCPMPEGFRALFPSVMKNSPSRG